MEFFFFIFKGMVVDTRRRSCEKKLKGQLQREESRALEREELPN